MKILPTLGPISIGIKSIEKAKQFYVPLFGLTNIEEDTNYFSAYMHDGTHIELEEDSENRFPKWAERNIGTYKCAEFFVADIHAFLEQVTSLGGSVVSEPTLRSWGNYCAEFADPEGNIFLISEKS